MNSIREPLKAEINSSAPPDKPTALALIGVVVTLVALAPAAREQFSANPQLSLIFTIFILIVGVVFFSAMLFLEVRRFFLSDAADGVLFWILSTTISALGLLAAASWAIEYALGFPELSTSVIVFSYIAALIAVTLLVIFFGYHFEKGVGGRQQAMVFFTAITFLSVVFSATFREAESDKIREEICVSLAAGVADVSLSSQFNEVCGKK